MAVATNENIGNDTSSFKGSFEHLLDDKGRVSLPADFRQVLFQKKINSVVITNFISDGARCLDGFALDDWKIFEAKLKSKSRFDPQIRKLENFYLARAIECSVDNAGRINIPQQLRTYAGFEKKIVFTAALHGFRIWDSRVWELIFRESETALLENPALFNTVDL
ncbi:MAG: division/cell wall cluster transcriptional repressor MraZ [Deltaproteobacteria bacterium]|jgi:MraZ protein|nr:division/cell wall cluster transcriptional repressor MraZ [Deltaproteobacteria bacterium]